MNAPFSGLRLPTPSEYIVIIAFVSFLLVVGGITALVVGFREPPEKHELALILEHRGAWCLASGIVIPLAIWTARRLID